MKAQGLPMNFLVLGALAVLVLVVVGGAFMSGGTSIFGGIAQFFTTTASTPQDQIISVCQTSCENLDYVIARSSDAVSKPICTKRFNFAVDTNTVKINCFGNIDGGGQVSGWPFSGCTVHSKTGTIIPVSSSSCTATTGGGGITPECTSDSGCADSEKCDAGICVTAVCDPDCVTGETCVHGSCVAPA